MASGIRLLLVDALNLIRRVYAAQPGSDGADKARDGVASSATSLQRALREVAPSHAVVVFEGPERTWRHDRHAGYKAGHKPMPDALRDALPAARDAFRGIGVRSFEHAATEADDVIATLATKVAAAGGAAVILSTDRVYLQLVSETITVRDHFARRDLDVAAVRDRYGVPPERYLDYLALTGDSTAGISGVPGVGPKRAVELLAGGTRLEQVLRGEPDPSDKLRAKVLTHADDAELARDLLRLRTDLELGLNLRDLRFVPSGSPSAERD